MTHKPMTLPELVISTQYHPYSHTSSFLDLDDGRILHTSGGVSNFSEDGGLTWSDQKLLKDTNGDDIFATSVLKLRDGKNALGLVGKIRNAPPAETPYPDFGAGGWVVFWRSDDLGETWSPPMRLTPPGFFNTISLQDSAIVTSAGRIVVPMFFQVPCVEDRPMPGPGRLVRNQWTNTVGHHFDKGISVIVVCYSDDGGRTWQRNQGGTLFVMQDMNSICRKVNEPSVTELPAVPETGAPRRLMMIMRTHLGRLFQSWSTDDGETWCEPQPTMLASVSAPGQIRTLPNGHLLCVWNQQSEDEFKRGYVRTRMSSAISRNGGGIWEFFQNIESMHDTAWVAPGPIRVVRPAGLYAPPGQPAIECDPAFIENSPADGRWTYPSVHVGKDRVTVAYQASGYLSEKKDVAQMYRDITDLPDVNTDLAGRKVMVQCRKILPLKWFYGGREPADYPGVKPSFVPVH